MLILDELLSSLDDYTQSNLIKYIKGLKGKATTFVIMHSPELDEYADVILDIRSEKLSLNN